MNPLDKFQQWSDELHAAGRAQADESVQPDLRAKLRVMIEYRRKQVQAATVRWLNELTPEQHCPVMVRAEAVNTESTLCCATDSAHGMATVYLTIDGDLFELCHECGISSVRDQIELRDGPNYIDVEVYR